MPPMPRMPKDPPEPPDPPELPKPPDPPEPPESPNDSGDPEPSDAYGHEPAQPPVTPDEVVCAASLAPRLSRSPTVRATVLSEAETPRGWTFVLALRRRGLDSEHTVTLSWRDHDYWCGGSMAPSRVVCCVVEYVAMHWQGAIPATFDASTARRWTPHLDRELHETM